MLVYLFHSQQKILYKFNFIRVFYSFHQCLSQNHYLSLSHLYCFSKIYLFLKKKNFVLNFFICIIIPIIFSSGLFIRTRCFLWRQFWSFFIIFISETISPLQSHFTSTKLSSFRKANIPIYSNNSIV